MAGVARPRIAWVFGAAGGLALASAAVSIAVVVPQLTTKAALFMLVGLFAALAIVMSGRAKEVLVAGYILALTYNRQYFSFDDILGNLGSAGLYWIPADAFLVMLLAVSLLERAVRIAPARPPADPIAVIAMPALAFLVPCVISALLAERPDMSFNELARVVRFIIVLVWLQSNMTRSLWYSAVGALALAMVAQAGLGTVQVVLKADRNFLSIFGVAGQEVLTADGEVDVIDNRARGTLGHPNYVAPYLLVMLPASLGVAYYSRAPLIRLIALAVLAIGLAGMAATKSRAPIALLGLSLTLVSAIAVRERRLSLFAALGGAVVALTVLAGVAAYNAAAIYDRIWGDFSASVTFRSEYNAAALAIWDEAPVFGIGLNNASLGLARHSPLFHWLTVQLEQFRGDAAVRAVAPVHNVYLLILAETGVFGLAGFIILLVSYFTRAIRGWLVSDDGVRGLCVGLSMGFLTQFVQQTLDFSQWFDPSWFTLAVLMAVVGSIPRLRPTIP